LTAVEKVGETELPGRRTPTNSREPAAGVFPGVAGMPRSA
jgi:hypothetical protein